MTERPAVLRTRVLGENIELAEETKKLFARHNLPIDVEVGGAQNIDMNSVLQVAASLIVFGPAAAFLSAFAGEAGKDAYRGLKAFLQDRRGQVSRPELVLLADLDAKLGVLLTDALPDKALRALFDLDLRSFAGDFAFINGRVLAWDFRSESWRLEKYPAARQDVFGWFLGPKRDGTDEQAWHMTRDATSSPIVTLCKQALKDRVHSDDINPSVRWVWCFRCMTADSSAQTGRFPSYWDPEAADFKSRQG